MQVNIPKIVKKIELKGYAPEFGDACLEVWVNPPVRVLERLRMAKQKVYELNIPKRELTPEEKSNIEAVIHESYEEQMVVYAELLGQGSDETRLGVDELKQMVDGTVDSDPMFWGWVQAQIVELINDHRGTAKKG
jgi:hypothetical protein